jgi:hypothetical protein
MTFSFECPLCRAVLRAKEEFGGKTAKCTHCGAIVQIPLMVEAEKRPAGRLLSDATPQEMVEELFRRQKSAVLAFVNMTASGASRSGFLDETRLKCVTTDDIDQDQLEQVFDRLAQLTAKKRVERLGVEVDDAEDLFELKGDRLGMKLEDFKAKYARKSAVSGRDLPWSSDQNPSVVSTDLCSQRWHHAAGIVHARIDDPQEMNSPTIAGVPTDLLLYQFIDGKLFQITALFGTEGFHMAHEALGEKYGPPVSETHQPRQLVWWTMSATIELTFGKIRPREPSVLNFYHDALLRLARSRQPDSALDV